ncbi:MAG: DNA mismatch repair endonuclease MutL [Bacteroidales bacterium]|jgi:DNA mismatch repair protein MutL|nr:DNA mismatch repair endonuclease MutL [Bacteroidales bacterium]
MSDVIRLLPDAVANQIAAGEVVQRPSSAVKELLENAVDAESTEIQLIVKDAGKTLIQVIDNGKGMSETDARLCFERHATSKIRDTQDLFSVRTMGFRGEALASIASIAQVELKTRQPDEELGTKIQIEGSEFKNQEACQCSKGTSVAVKNLFFNVPARRQFLKSDNAELKHISEEFYRVALVHPHLKFSFYHNEKCLLNLEPSSFRERIVSLFGDVYKKRLVQIEQSVSHVKISGFICKPEFAMKTKGDQYFFVNNRFIRHPYLNHAVSQAFEELIAEKSYTSYFIRFEIDPKNIDINIHPTKTEIKFLDEKLLYGVLLAAVKKSIGAYNLSPSLDFLTNPEYQPDILPKDYSPKTPTVHVNPNYNPFEKTNFSELRKKQLNQQAYLESFELLQKPIESGIQKEIEHTIEDDNTYFDSFQISNKYLVVDTRSGLLIVCQQRAHERILFEQFQKQIANRQAVSQQKLFPQSLDFSATNAETLNEVLPNLKDLGWDIESLGHHSFVVNATPSDVKESDVQNVLELILENFKSGIMLNRNDKQTNLAVSMACSMAIKSGNTLDKTEQKHLLTQLFACQAPQLSPKGKPVFSVLSEDEIHTRLN